MFPKSEWVGNEVDCSRTAGRVEQCAGVVAGPARPRIGNAQSEEMSRRSADLFAIDNREIRWIGGVDGRLRHSEIVIGDRQERKIGVSGSSDHLRQASAPAGKVGVDVQHSDALSTCGSAIECGQSSEPTIECNNQ